MRALLLCVLLRQLVQWGCRQSFKFLAFTLCSRVNIFGVWHFVSHIMRIPLVVIQLWNVTVFTSGGKFLRRYLPVMWHRVTTAHLSSRFVFKQCMWLFVRCGWVKWKKGRIAFFNPFVTSRHVCSTYKESFQVHWVNSIPHFLHAAIYLEVSLFRWTSQNAFSRETAVYKW